MREAIHAFKFRAKDGRGKDARAHCRGWRRKRPDRAIDAIVPMPVTEKRLKARGFNQSFIIAEELSRSLGAPVDCESLVKVRQTEDQYTLSKKERKRNIRGAFSAAAG